MWLKILRFYHFAIALPIIGGIASTVALVWQKCIKHVGDYYINVHVMMPVLLIKKILKNQKNINLQWHTSLP